MPNHSNNNHDSETSGLNSEQRHLQLRAQKWNRAHSTALAANEGLRLDDEHWAVIKYLRKHYIEHGTPRHARTLARDLNQQFADQGGSHYLRQLFKGGPVTQGNRLANLRIPDNASDSSFGTQY